MYVMLSSCVICFYFQTCKSISLLSDAVYNNDLLIAVSFLMTGPATYRVVKGEGKKGS